MSEREIKPLVDFKNMRDILRELEDSRAEEISTKVADLIVLSRNVGSAGKIDGLASQDKKDGGKDCGTDGKEGKEDSEGKETCDPEGAELIFGDPARIDRGLLSRLSAIKEGRLQDRLRSERPIF